jgi:pimeloyl-ACP methyl ester carboxylesterase
MTVQDSIDLTHVASTNSSRDSLLVFFITGNPGLIEYYRTFLTLCFDSLRTNYSDLHIKVAGTSLRGFGVQDHGHHLAARDNAEGPYDLEQQIEHIGRMLERAIQSHARQGFSTKVILMGHSVGSYILLEVLRRRKQSPATQQLSHDAKVIGGICLFPTVTHIAKSPSGKKFSVCCFWSYHTCQRDPPLQLCLYPPLATLIDLCYCSYSLPFRILRPSQAWLYACCSPGFPSVHYKPSWALLLDSLLRQQSLRLHSSRAKAVSDKHCRFQVLSSSSCLFLTCTRYLAGHEMRTITADTWDDELWGLSKAQNSNSDKTKLYFYFGTNDHWVADETRDELIAARAATGQAGDENKPTMEIDTHGTPHGFCISKSLFC